MTRGEGVFVVAALNLAPRRGGDCGAVPVGRLSALSGRGSAS